MATSGVKRAVAWAGKLIGLGYSSNREIPGANYPAVQNEDGTWNVMGVRMYASHERKVPIGYKNGEVEYRTIKVGRKELEEIVAYHKAMRSDQKFLFPLHVNHHEYVVGRTNQAVMGAGYFIPTAVIREKLDGKQEDVLIGNLIGVRPHVFAMMERNELPYCSVERLELDKPVLSSLSSMEHDVPYFKFPLMTIGAKTPHAKFMAAPPAVLASVEAASLASAVTLSLAYEQFGKKDDDKPADDKPADDSKGNGEGGDKPAADAPPGTEAGEEKPVACEKCGYVAQDEDEELEGDDMGKLGSAIALLTEQMGKLLKIAGVQDTAPAPTQGGTPGVQAASLAAALTGGNADAVARAKSDAERDAKIALLERQGTMREQAKKWAAELVAYNLGADIEQKLYDMAMDVKRGEAACVAYVEATKKVGTPMPPRSSAFLPASGTGGSTLEGQMPQEVLAYSKDGPEAVQKALVAYASWADAKSHNVHGGTDAKVWIERQLSKTFKVA